MAKQPVKQGTNDATIRPDTLKNFIGQGKIVKTLSLFIDAVKKRGTAGDHVLFYGPPGMGKTTLAYIIAHELTGDIKITSGAAVQKSGDLAAILTNLKDHDVLFIDEIHRLPKTVEEMLYPVLDEYALDIVIGKGPSARTVRLTIPKITIVGATTRLALMSSPLRDRFGLLLRLDFYGLEEISVIIANAANTLGLKLTKGAVAEIAKRSRRTPRIALRILRRARDIQEVQNHKVIDEDVLIRLFAMLEIDEYGLADIDRKYLKLLGKKFSNSPVGVETIASSLSEDRQTIEEYIEPYLLQIGFIKKTPRGRVLTSKAADHIGSPLSAQQKLL